MKLQRGMKFSYIGKMLIILNVEEHSTEIHIVDYRYDAHRYKQTLTSFYEEFPKIKYQIEMINQEDYNGETIAIAEDYKLQFIHGSEYIEVKDLSSEEYRIANKIANDLTNNSLKHLHSKYNKNLEMKLEFETLNTTDDIFIEYSNEYDPHIQMAKLLYGATRSSRGETKRYSLIEKSINESEDNSRDSTTTKTNLFNKGE